MTGVSWRNQLFSYAAVGVASNAIAYLCYLALTLLGLWPECAMTITYLSCALLGYLANRKLTFSHQGNMISSGARYVVVQAVGYAINAILLFTLVHRFNYPHAWIQAMAILLVAPVLFLGMKFFVFRREGK